MPKLGFGVSGFRQVSYAKLVNFKLFDRKSLKQSHVVILNNSMSNFCHLGHHFFVVPIYNVNLKALNATMEQ